MKTATMHGISAMRGILKTLSLVILWPASILIAQSCTASLSCPTNGGNNCDIVAFNNCPTGTGVGGDHGSDPNCRGFSADPCKYIGGCPNGKYSVDSCCIQVLSPIVIDTRNEGFHFSDAAGGVWFHTLPAQTGTAYQVSWPVEGSHNGWLVLDRNDNGLIDDFGEFFGDQTIQPVPQAGKSRNGFAALAVYDSSEQGGNGDGWITSQDSVYDNLRVWIDDNRDGVSQPAELHALAALGISAIRLQYELTRVQDSNGNLFRYRSSIRDGTGGEASMTIYDVLVHLGAARSDDNAASWFASPAGSKSTVSSSSEGWTPPN